MSRPQYQPLRDRGEDPLLDSPDSSETGLLLGPHPHQQQLPRPHTTTGVQQQSAGAGQGQQGGDRSISPASVAAARDGSSTTPAPSAAAEAEAAAAGAAVEGGEAGVLVLRVKTLDSKEYRVEVAPTATVAEVREVLSLFLGRFVWKYL